MKLWGAVVAAVAVGLLVGGCSGEPSVADRSKAHPTQSSTPTSAGSSPSAQSLNPSATPDPPVDAQAAAILQAADAQMRSEFEQGVAVHGTSAQLAWFKTYGDGQKFLAQSKAAFQEADGLFTVDDEPTDAITAWLDDSSDIAGNAQQWYLSTSGSTATVDADFAKMEADANAVRAFH